MARFIEFKRLKHYSLGNATLNVVKNELEISGIRDTGSDGVLIEIPQGKNWQVEMQPVKIEAEKLLNICYRGIDQIGRLKTFGEIVYGINPANNKPSTALNSWLLSEKLN